MQRQNRDLAQDEYESKILSLDSEPRDSKIEIAKVYPAANEQEREILLELKREAETRLLGLPTASGPSASPPPKGPAERELLEGAIRESEIINREPAVKTVRHPDQRRYDYYQVIYWSASCVDCHEHMYGQYSQSAASNIGGVFDPASRPFRVVKVTMPDTVTRDNVNKTQAILWAVGILTVFLAVMALHYVVRYIVIKPLNHLREVSDAVARGDVDQRADIHTNDEFEDLAVSFNKMLVHLVETQGELQDANLELDHKVDELAHLNMQLHEMNRLKGEFLANMSHELRTPLNSIIGFSEVLQSLDALNEKQKRYAQNIQKSGRQLMDMINDILDLAKMEAGKMEVRLSEFRIDQVIANQCDMVREMAEEKNIDLRTEIDGEFAAAVSGPDEGAADFDESAVQRDQVHARRGPDHRRRRGDPRGQIEFWVADTGVGIAESEREIIFEKFRQGKAVLGRDNLTREYSGTGLGLSIVKELCKLLGGEITVESELGKGSTFRVVIPWMRTDTAAAAAKLAARLDDVSRPRRIENLRDESSPVEVAAAGQGS